MPRFNGGWLFGLLAGAGLVPAVAAAECTPWVARLVSLEGSVEVRRDRADDWQAAALGQTYCYGDRLRVAADSRASVELNNDTLLRLDQKSTLLLPEAPRQGLSFIELLRGALHLISRTRRGLEIRTPFANAGLEGTEFVVRVLDDRTLVSVVEGKVAVSNAHGRLDLVGGQSATGGRAAAPVLRLDIAPADAVQWALHYPMVADPAAPGVAGDIARAQRLLAGGRVDEARRLVRAARERAPDDGDALAVAAVIALAGNDRTEALDLARQAVARDGGSGAAQLALSYAHQARFELAAALQAAAQAVAVAPDNALAWARLAELWAALGDRTESLAAAERAVALDPGLSRTQTVLGFAHLARFATTAAAATFNRAIALDSADPLPRLGLGLAKIRRGDLAAGRRDLEIAASLDPGRSLVRSYLGKAYLEEGRYAEAATELQLAQAFDPLDPTPWLYEALLLQAENRPVEALRALDESVARNDNRAVYRSRLLLDEDAAARAAGVADIHAQTGDQAQALRRSTDAVSRNHANHSAHRLLADAYRGMPRRDIARVSELLQAQLYQPLVARPVAPSSQVRELDNAVGQPFFAAGGHEYLPLFERDGTHVGLIGQIGTADTGSGELLVSGLADRLAYSLGYFRSQTDGFRPNAFVDRQAFNGFAQYALNDALSLQLEGRRTAVRQGVLTLTLDPAFDPADFAHDRAALDLDLLRVGARYRLGPATDLVGALTYADRVERSLAVTQDPFFGQASSATHDRRRGTAFELQGSHRSARLGTVLGVNVYRVERTLDTLDVLPLIGALPDRLEDDIDARTAYAYLTLNRPSPLVWTLGLSYDDYRERRTLGSPDRRVSAARLNPKLGLRWNLSERLELRGAWLQSIKRQRVFDQSLEPTQVAGFVQFFDDFNSSRAELAGLGLGYRLARGIDLQVEGTRRRSQDLAAADRLAEQAVDAHLALTPNERWVASLGYEWQFDRRRGSAPLALKTVAFPATVAYFHPSGWSGSVRATHVRQDYRVPGEAAQSADFTNVDAALTHKLAMRRGSVSLGVRNLLDKDIRYRDAGYKTSDDFNVFRPFLPGREVHLTFALNY